MLTRPCEKLNQLSLIKRTVDWHERVAHAGTYAIRSPVLLVKGKVHLRKMNAACTACLTSKSTRKPRLSVRQEGRKKVKPIIIGAQGHL